MITPNLALPASDNVREYLRHKVGQTVTTGLVIKETAESHGAVTGEFSRLANAGVLKNESKEGRSVVYLVTPKIGRIALSGKGRPANHRRPGRSVGINGSRFKVESNVKIPEQCAYPLDSIPYGEDPMNDEEPASLFDRVTYGHTRLEAKLHNILRTIERLETFV